MIERTEAIILKTQNFSETSRIVSAFTRQFGRMKFMAKGARKPKSRFGASFQPPLRAAHRLRDRRGLGPLGPGRGRPDEPGGGGPGDGLQTHRLGVAQYGLLQESFGIFAVTAILRGKPQPTAGLFSVGPQQPGTLPPAGFLRQMPPGA